MTERPLSFQIIKLVEKHGWKDLSFDKIAESIGISLADLREKYTQKEDILIDFNKGIDQKILSEISKEDLAGAAPRDQIQELFLYRFEILGPYKQALKIIYKDMLFHPTDLVPNMIDNLSSLNWLLSLSDADLNGFLGFAKSQGLKVIYVLSFKKWLEDDSKNQEKIMAFLDKSLRFGERIIDNYR